MRNSIFQRPDDNVPSVAIVLILSCKGDQVFTGTAVSLWQDTHTQTHTHAHIHTCTRDLCSILSASSSPHSMVPNTNQQIACLKKKSRGSTLHYIAIQWSNIKYFFTSRNSVFFFNLFSLSLISLYPLISHDCFV